MHHRRWKIERHIPALERRRRPRRRNRNAQRRTRRHLARLLPKRIRKDPRQNGKGLRPRAAFMEGRRRKGEPMSMRRLLLPAASLFVATALAQDFDLVRSQIKIGGASISAGNFTISGNILMA